MSEHRRNLAWWKLFFNFLIAAVKVAGEVLGNGNGWRR